VFYFVKKAPVGDKIKKLTFKDMNHRKEKALGAGDLNVSIIK